MIPFIERVVVIFVSDRTAIKHTWKQRVHCRWDSNAIKIWNHLLVLLWKDLSFAVVDISLLPATHFAWYHHFSFVKQSMLLLSIFFVTLVIFLLIGVLLLYWENTCWSFLGKCKQRNFNFSLGNFKKVCFWWKIVDFFFFFQKLCLSHLTFQACTLLCRWGFVTPSS